MDAKKANPVDDLKATLKQMLQISHEQQQQINIAKDYIKGRRNPYVINSIELESLLNEKAKKYYIQKAKLKTQQQNRQHELAAQQMQKIFSQPISRKQEKRTGVPIVFSIKPPPIQPELRFQWRLK